MQRDLIILIEIRSIRLTIKKEKESDLSNISNKTIRSGNILIKISKKRAGLRNTDY